MSYKKLFLYSVFAVFMTQGVEAASEIFYPTKYRSLGAQFNEYAYAVLDDYCRAQNISMQDQVSIKKDILNLAPSIEYWSQDNVPKLNKEFELLFRGLENTSSTLAEKLDAIAKIAIYFDLTPKVREFFLESCPILSNEIIQHHHDRGPLSHILSELVSPHVCSQKTTGSSIVGNMFIEYVHKSYAKRRKLYVFGLAQDLCVSLGLLSEKTVLEPKDLFASTVEVSELAAVEAALGSIPDRIAHIREKTRVEMERRREASATPPIPMAKPINLSQPSISELRARLAAAEAAAALAAAEAAEAAAARSGGSASSSVKKEK